MGRRILNRKDLRADFDAAERRQQDGEERDESDKEEEDEDEEQEGDAEADKIPEAEPNDESNGEEEEAPKKRKPAAKPAKPKPRSRVAKVTRLKVVWGVFNNSNQRVAVFDYPKREEAEALAAKLKADKKTTHFVQAVKEPMEEKKDS